MGKGAITTPIAPLMSLLEKGGDGEGVALAEEAQEGAAYVGQPYLIHDMMLMIVGFHICYR